MPCAMLLFFFLLWYEREGLVAGGFPPLVGGLANLSLFDRSKYLTKTENTSFPPVCERRIPFLRYNWKEYSLLHVPQKRKHFFSNGLKKHFLLYGVGGGVTGHI